MGSQAPVKIDYQFRRAGCGWTGPTLLRREIKLASDRRLHAIAVQDFALMAKPSTISCEISSTTML